MSVGTQFKQSGYYSEFYVGVKAPVRFTIYERTDGVLRPHDLTQYDSLHLLVYDTDADVSARIDLPLTALASTADKVLDVDETTLVVARCSGEVTVSGAAGVVRVKLAGKKGSTFYMLGKPWQAEFFLGGPNA